MELKVFYVFFYSRCFMMLTLKKYFKKTYLEHLLSYGQQNRSLLCGNNKIGWLGVNYGNCRILKGKFSGI